jgi:hypothetical protein
MTDHEPTPRCALASCRAHFLPSQPGQRYCSRTHARTAEKQRQRERKKFGETVKELVTRRMETYDTDPPQHWSDVEDEQGRLGDEDAAPVHEADKRFAAMIAGEDIPGRGTRSTTPGDLWKRAREFARRNPGVESAELTQHRIARQWAAYDASMARLDSYTAGRVQDRHDPRTASNPGRNGAASRRLNQRYTEMPPAWTTAEFDFTNETTDGGPFTRGRPSGQRSRHADYAWNMRDGW